MLASTGAPETAMQNAALFHVLLDHLESIGTSPQDVERFVDRWHRLRSHEAFPCPVCYLTGIEQPLLLQPAQGEFAPAECPGCHAHFEVPLED
ncbi:hypothetical protein GCM10027093_21900 [Paraburkholderia jirisanensis]